MPGIRRTEVDGRHAGLVDRGHLHIELVVAIRTKRWDEPQEAEDGLRILITRFRPRGLPKEKETWDIWRKELAPSPDLVKAYREKDPSHKSITWEVYRSRYLKEMQDPAARAQIEKLADAVAAGHTITLLCSSTCYRESRCHRSLLKQLIEEEVARRTPAGPSSTGRK